MLYRPETTGDRWTHYRYAAETILVAWTNRFNEWRRTRSDIRQLRRLDDRLLADVGVNRDEIAARVRGGR